MMWALLWTSDLIGHALGRSVLKPPSSSTQLRHGFTTGMWHEILVGGTILNGVREEASKKLLPLCLFAWDDAPGTGRAETP